MRKWVVLLVILLLTSGCSSSTPSPTETPEGAISPLISPLPNPTLAPPPPTPSSPDVGIIVGVILQGSQNGPQQPVDGSILALGTVLTLADGTPAMARLDRQNAPRTMTDADGRLVYTDVPPGQYALFVDLITKAVALRNPDTGGDFFIEVEAGETTDLGDLVYSSMPTP